MGRFSMLVNFFVLIALTTFLLFVQSQQGSVLYTTLNTRSPTLQPTSQRPTASPSTSRPTISPTGTPQWRQQGAKLVGTGYSVGGSPSEGYAVGLSSDGNTLVEIANDGSNRIAWIFTRSNGVWSQTTFFIPSDITTGIALDTCAISGDGNTVVVGATGDNSQRGANWVFHYNGTNWIQQGTKIVGVGAVGTSAGQGSDVSIVSNGTVFVSGAPSDNGTVGAAWIFSLSGTSWGTGTKFIPASSTGSSHFGTAVAISGDASTIAIGAPGGPGNLQIGAVWIYVSSGGASYIQQGSKLVPNNTVTTVGFGNSLAISSDGNTLAIGGTNYDTAWIFTRSGTVWSQQTVMISPVAYPDSYYYNLAVALNANGNRLAIGWGENSTYFNATYVYTKQGNSWNTQATLYGTGGAGVSYEGSSLAMDSAGVTLAVGGYNDNYLTGAVWMFAYH